MKQVIEFEDGDLAYIMARVDRLTVALENFNRILERFTSLELFGYKILKWGKENGNS